jgi:hypothetical protein
LLFSEEERTGFEDKDPMVTPFVAVPHVFCESRSERAATEDDQVEIARFFSSTADLIHG